MTKKRLPRPTEAELRLLQILWQRGPSTVREILDASGEETGYTTVLKLLQIMFEKGLVKRNEAERTHVYSAAAPAAATRRQIVGGLIERAFDGSAAKLVLHAIHEHAVSPDELEEIRATLERLRKGRP